MSSPLVPAELAFDAAGTPYSPLYGDVYHSSDSGPGQARHVFLGGNDLPSRWAGARVFTLVETGFGLGLNFLATWQAWREDPARPGRLHFVSVEKHPFEREALSGLHARYPEFAPLSAKLQAAWPPLVPGLHRLEFEGGGVTLSLVLADALDALAKLELAADAFYLDGFAPDRNPDLWSPAALKALARLARPGATFATYTTARVVRDNLTAAGFAVESRPGFGRKRQMLAGRFSPRWRQRYAPHVVPVWPERRAIIIGAGLAGAAAAERLATRGWQIDLIERHGAPAMEASGLPAGIFHPLIARDDSILARLTRAGFLYALDRWRALEAAGHRFTWARCGVLQLARDAREEARMAATARALGYPARYAEYVPLNAAVQRTGCPVGAGGWWFDEGGWVQPATLVAAQLAAAGKTRDRRGVTVHYGHAVQTLARRGEFWCALAGDGAVIATAPVVVLANAHDAAHFVAAGTFSLKRVRGQLTCLPPGSPGGLRAVIAGAGCLVPVTDGTVVGASYDADNEDVEPDEAGHEGNLARLARLLPNSDARYEPAALAGGVGFRCVAADRLPLIGALPDVVAARAQAAALSGLRLREVPRLPGLYGAFAYASRGLTWATLGGELIACEIEGEPLPMERDLADAINPGRFVLQSARRGKLRQ